MEQSQTFENIKCAARSCTNNAETRLKVSLVHLVGDFCNQCASKLVHDGLASREVN